MFDIAKLADYAQSEIKAFALNHANETFYAFSLDANLLCLNSEEMFEESLKSHQGSEYRYSRKSRTNHWSEGGNTLIHHARLALILAASRLAQFSRSTFYDYSENRCSITSSL